MSTLRGFGIREWWGGVYLAVWLEIYELGRGIYVQAAEEVEDLEGLELFRFLDSQVIDIEGVQEGEMHYIRFLKTPRLLSSGRGNAPSVVKAKVTVTTDLGESFLWADIGLVVELTDGTGSKVLGKGKEYAWKGSEGKRDLEIELVAPVSREKRPGQVLRLLVRPKDEFRSVDALESSLRSSNGSESTEGEGCVMAVRSMAINTVSSEFKTIGTGMAERTFKVGNSELHIWEETGESIARHIWYGSSGP